MENEDKRLAWFPAPYLELNEEEEENDNEFLLGGAILALSYHAMLMLLLLAHVTQMEQCLHNRLDYIAVVF